MPHFNSSDELYLSASSNSHFMASSSSRKSTSQQSLQKHRSTASLRAHTLDDDALNGRHHSLAHELAVALMPEPSAGSKLLAEEFGIEFDEDAGVEALDPQHSELNGQGLVNNLHTSSFSLELATSLADDSLPELAGVLPEQEYDPAFHSPALVPALLPQRNVEQDAMEVLSADLESTDKFLNNLRILDIESGPSSQPILERLASDIIRRMNTSARDREGHVRELLEYEREFRKIAGEVGGGDILGQLDEFTFVEELSDVSSRLGREGTERRNLEVVEEEPSTPIIPGPHHISDWELDSHRRLGDEDELSEPPTSPVKDSYSASLTGNDSSTASAAVRQLHDLRNNTTSLVSSLTTISEQAQVNGAATAEAGRKIRALKNKLGDWRTEWDSAERSRLKIERWEAGIVDGEDAQNININLTTTPTRATSKRMDGRHIVAEHLQAFELALADATRKTQAIMTR